jgi:hypothetical protein
VHFARERIPHRIPRLASFTAGRCETSGRVPISLSLISSSPSLIRRCTVEIIHSYIWSRDDLLNREAKKERKSIPKSTKETRKAPEAREKCKFLIYSKKKLYYSTSCCLDANYTCCFFGVKYLLFRVRFPFSSSDAQTNVDKREEDPTKKDAKEKRREKPPITIINSFGETWSQWSMSRHVI